MTTDTKLLPLPELPVAVERFILSSLGPVKREGAVTALRTMLREYARANVAHATAAQDAEIARLTEALEFQSALKKNLLPYQDEAVASRAEIEALRAEVGRAWKAEDEWRRVANTNGGRAERLAGALKRARESIEEWAYFAQSCGGEITGLQEELSEIDLTLREPQEVRTKRYVQGVGWCWMEDGEVIEVISEATV